MTAILLPRLPAVAAQQLIGAFTSAPDQWAGFDPRRLPDPVRWAPTGGSRLSVFMMAELRDAVHGIAQKHGMPRKGDTTGFDHEASVFLAQHTMLQGGEALRDDVWAFIGTVLMPDVAYWRFGKSAERYAGGVRNTFQRLRMRGVVLDRGAASRDRWGLVSGLTEDALVQIMERPSISGDTKLARAVAEAWLRAAERYRPSSMEDVMRKAVLRIRIRNQIRALTLLPEAELGELLDGIFNDAAEAVLGQNELSLRDAVLPFQISKPAPSAEPAEKSGSVNRAFGVWEAD